MKSDKSMVSYFEILLEVMKFHEILLNTIKYCLVLKNNLLNLAKLLANFLLNMSFIWIVCKKVFLSINDPFDFISLISSMQNGQNLSQLLFRTLTKFGGKVQNIFELRLFNFVPFHLVQYQNLSLFANIAVT
jgi:hypothetical protein